MSTGPAGGLSVPVPKSSCYPTSTQSVRRRASLILKVPSEEDRLKPPGWRWVFTRARRTATSHKERVKHNGRDTDRESGILGCSPNSNGKHERAGISIAWRPAFARGSQHYGRSARAFPATGAFGVAQFENVCNDACDSIVSLPSCGPQHRFQQSAGRRFQRRHRGERGPSPPTESQVLSLSVSRKMPQERPAASLEGV
jgi:hypothetical protein